MTPEKLGEFIRIGEMTKKASNYRKTDILAIREYLGIFSYIPGIESKIEDVASVVDMFSKLYKYYRETPEMMQPHYIPPEYNSDKK